MRKKILRSRSGFEKPESREEAIMQNILGASNVLEPSESNIEEILKSILYNTPYTKEAEFEIEKILLAIKNNGTYDGEGESRDMKILIAILNDLDYTEEAESRIEELFIEWLHQRSSIKVLEGIPPLTFTSLGQPLINYLIEGNTTQSGTPTSDNPIMPQGTGDRTGNLCDKVFVSGYNIASNGYPTPYTPNNSRCATLEAIDVSNQNTVTFSYTNTVSDNKRFIYSLFNGNTLVIREADKSTGTTIDVSQGNKLYLCVYSNLASVNAAETTTNIMLNTGSTAIPYEPYGYKIPISSANTTTPVYLGEVETTRKVKKLVLTGKEDWSQSGAVSNTFYTTISGYLRQRGVIIDICSHYTSQANINGVAEMQDGNVSFYANAGQPLEYFYVRDSNLATVANLKSYLQQQYAAGTPVTVWYVLATEETGIVNEPLMRIGDYADSISKEQTGIEIPTENGSNTLDVGTTVKPSNVYIEYK